MRTILRVEWVAFISGPERFSKYQEGETEIILPFHPSVAKSHVHKLLDMLGEHLRETGQFASPQHKFDPVDWEFVELPD